MKKRVFLIIYVILFLILIVSPFWLWAIQPSKQLNVLILDKTVPNETFREHKGLVWVLNNSKYLLHGNRYSSVSDYKGFYPESGNKYKIVPLPKNLKNYDVFYLTDQYGVYKKDFNGINPTGKRSEKIYGGLTAEEAERLETTLIQSKNKKTLIAEFNTFASPTEEVVKDKISNLLNVEWTGWTGRYFSDLNSNEVPEWVKRNYKKQQKKWSFKGEGFVFVSKNNYIVAVEKKDVRKSGLLFNLTKKGKAHFENEFTGTYQYWFDIVEPRDTNEVLASYKLPISETAKKRLEAYGIPDKFPAVIYHQNAKYSSYYFSGDYADEPDIPNIYQTKGIDLWKRYFGEKDSFYWTAYVPMMKDILKNGLHQQFPQEKIELTKQAGITTNSKTGDSFIQIKKNGKWENFLIKGVNMGIGKPGYFPGETAISKDEYFRWFKEIGAMNANAIRVYTLHPPEFYEALYKYNQIAKKPLYLFHGTWVNEENLIHTQDAFEQVNTDDAKLEIKNMIDIIHGNANLPKRPGHASGTYKYDISKYVIGMLIGTEWDPSMVSNTNEKHRNVKQYNGVYFQTNNAQPFEIWLAGLLDYAAKYEVDNYQWQHTLSFTNWVTTDLLKHPAEPLETEDLVSVNPNHITPTGELKAGYFASYHIYPYYPDFLNYEKKYLDYVDHFGEKNNYAGYLHELKSSHHMPVIVAEFGVPSSRGLTHKNVYGMNQGFHSETEQGHIDQKLFRSIVSEGYAGGLVFTWQDEWFKRTWNTMDFDNPDRRPYWNNQQTNEQHFGLLSFEPANKETKIIVDGNMTDWDLAGVKKGYTTKSTKDPLKEVRMTSDSGYFYFLLKFNRPIDFQKQGTFLLLDTIANQGQTSISMSENAKVNTNFGVDFLVKLNGPRESRIMVDSYYDTFYYQYAQLLNMIKKEPNVNQKNNGVFHPIRLALNKELTIPSTNTKIPFEEYETGILKFGNDNPDHKDFNSLTDVSISNDHTVMEGRIPWQLLNFRDPSLKEVMGDIWKTGLTEGVSTDGIRVAVVTTSQAGVESTLPTQRNSQIVQNDAYLYRWEEWNEPSYYERLKQSYYLMKETYR
ncbi:hypothetical protein [Neobacillus sp. LXY-1]|uniref:hypothetical protein n=1 Tax=Neobacillus sp. LXY-1 TaxID=3379133 RepID=UPI003EDF7A74